MGRLAAYVAGEVGCRIYPRRSLAASARDRDGVGYSASILQVPLSPIPPRGFISEPVTNRDHGRF
jgi:hypothetical protein